MDKNSWIGILLIVATLFLWSYFTKPSPEQIAEQQRYRDSVANVIHQKQLNDALLKAETSANATITNDNEQAKQAVIEQNISSFGDFAPFATGQQQFYTIQNNLVKLTFSSLGGRIYSAELLNYKRYDSLPLVLFDGDSTIFGLNFFAQNRNISTSELFFKANTNNQNLNVTDNPVSLVFALPIDSSRFIEYEYTLAPDSYVVDFNVNIKGLGKTISSNTGAIDLKWESYIKSLEKGFDWELQNTTVLYKSHGGDVDNLSERNDDVRESISTRLKWVSYKQQFFNVTLIAGDYFSGAELRSEKEIVNANLLKKFSAAITVPYSGKDNENIAMQFYIGPNHYKTLRKLNLDLEELVTLGRSVIRWVNVFITIPLFNWLGKYIGNYGIIILLMTIIIKIVLFPFTYKSYMSTAKMKALKPEVDKVTEKYSKPEDAMKKQQATMDLYKKVGVNPMGGCLPMLFQMPILIALFRFFPNSIELRQESFLWATDLSSYDSIFELPFSIPFYGSHVSLFCLLMTVVNVIYTKANMQMNASNQQVPGMKLMMYMMPVMMMFWFNSYASGLSYYYFVSLLITIIQTWVIRKTVNDEEVLAKLKAAQANKKAPQKSKFQQRMEDMAKQRGYKMPKK